MALLLLSLALVITMTLAQEDLTVVVDGNGCHPLDHQVKECARIALDRTTSSVFTAMRRVVQVGQLLVRPLPHLGRQKLRLRLLPVHIWSRR